MLNLITEENQIHESGKATGREKVCDRDGREISEYGMESNQNELYTCIIYQRNKLMKLKYYTAG